MSIDPNCENCLKWQSDSGVDFRWVPCTSGGCRPCGTDMGYRHPETCLTNPDNLPPIDCDRSCYSQCTACQASGCKDPKCYRAMQGAIRVENYNDTGPFVLCPQDYATLNLSWKPQQRYQLG